MTLYIFHPGHNVMVDDIWFAFQLGLTEHIQMQTMWTRQGGTGTVHMMCLDLSHELYM